jgi:hypothetical protein
MGLLIAILAATLAGGSGAETFYRPYAKPDVDFIYNLLLCDDPQLFRRGGAKPTGPLAIVLAKDAPMDELERIAGTDALETRVRVLAYNRLRADNVTVPRGLLLGVVVEVAMPEGLDVLAAFSDGRIRYINHIGKLVVIESATSEMSAEQARLMKAAEIAIRRIGPWDKPRLPPPTKGKARLTFLVSDGLYFGEGAQSAIARDQVSGPVFAAASQLLVAVVHASAGH